MIDHDDRFDDDEDEYPNPETDQPANRPAKPPTRPGRGNGPAKPKDAPLPPPNWRERPSWGGPPPRKPIPGILDLAPGDVLVASRSPKVPAGAYVLPADRLPDMARARARSHATQQRKRKPALRITDPGHPWMQDSVEVET